MKRLLTVLTATAALAGVASADMMEPPVMSACNYKKPGDACHVEEWRGSPGFDGVCDKELICVSKDEKKKKAPKRSTLGAVLLALSAGSLEILRRTRRPV
jgi:hypothetical protein